MAGEDNGDVLQNTKINQYNPSNAASCIQLKQIRML